ncbi:hypothetical protein N9P55_01260 [bacterium]|nr:hypothetical protein [bacterium]MDB4088690.1 hypothetical protein [Flavobacteriales bacterium]
MTKLDTVLAVKVEELMIFSLEIEVSASLQNKEYSLRDPDGFFLIIAEYLTYQV